MIAETLDKTKFEYQVKFTEYAGHASEIARQCVDENIDVVVAVGGDGTVNEVARSLVHSRTALGIIPCGSGNGLARHLSIPIDIKKSIDIINRYNIETFDYGVINELPFFCTCGMGFDAFISQKFASSKKRGPITYIENVLKEGLDYQPETYELEDETGTKKHKAFLIACANASQYGNNAYAFDAPQISIDIFSKTLDKNSKIKTFKAKRIHIHRNTPGPIHYDGEPIMTGTDIDVHIEERGIRIITNPEVIETDSRPNFFLNAFAELYYNINNVRKDIEKQGRRIQTINKALRKKLKNNKT